MRHAEIGTSGIRSSRLGLGCMSFAGVYGDGDETEITRTVKEALALGVTMFDTADVYGSGRSESLLGRALAGRRDQAIIATKFGNIDHAGSQPTSELFEGRWETCGRPDYVKSACDRSLTNLGVETIDLYYIHRIDPTVPIEDTIGAMAELVSAGKIRAIGLSEAGETTIRRAHAVHPVAALQSEYSLWSRDVEAKVLPLCRELGISFVAYSPLGRGFLTGKVPRVNELSQQDWRRHQPRFETDNYEKNRKLLDQIDGMAKEKSCTKGQLALAWVLARESNMFAIPGSKTVAHLSENAGAADIALSVGDIAALDAAFPLGAAAGARYPEAQMRRVEQ